MIDAMKQALEALEIVTRHFTRTPSTLKDSEARSTAHAAITALRLAIEQAEKQKPMHPELRKMWEDYFDKCFRDAPPQRQPLTDGWVAVPIEPTDEMLSVLVNIPLRPCVQPGGVTSIEAQGLNVVWSAMLDAAPKHGIGGEA
jgi:hypothetical protein